MGESTFSLWCGQAGLIANGSRIDRTGWDYYVEFPSLPTGSAEAIHAAAIECKVQVKASDRRKRRLAVKLSNLRRLATAQMPAFFVFMEFDGSDTVQRAYLVHVGKRIIERTLRRVHELEQLQQRDDHHNQTISIGYGPENEILPLTGRQLKSIIESFISTGLADYISSKKQHLESVGFEDGFARFTLTTEGEQNLRDLIDVSIGAKRSVEIQSFRGFHTRFGITSKSPMVDATGRLEMPDLKPTALGHMYVREDRLSPGLAFACRLFVSPLSRSLPRELAKMRVDGEFFNLTMNPFTGAAEYKFDAGVGVVLPLARLRDVVRLLFLITSSPKRLTASFEFSGFPKFEMGIQPNGQEFGLSRELGALDSAVEILYKFGVDAQVEVTLAELSRNVDAIRQFHAVLETDGAAFKVEFSVDGVGFDSSKNVACISVTSVRLGQYVLGAILVVKGRVTSIPHGRYQLLSSDATIERRLVSDSSGVILRKDLVAAVREVEKRYESGFEVVTMFDKNEDGD